MLYGQPVSRIVRIRTGHISQRDDETYLTINQSPPLLPLALTTLVHALSQTATPKSHLAGLGSPTNLLFPGQHRSVNYLVRELNHHGVYARPARNAALLDLAGDLPAAILADLLGMHINTATRWIKKPNATGPATSPPEQPRGRRTRCPPRPTCTAHPDEYGTPRIRGLPRYNKARFGLNACSRGRVGNEPAIPR